MSVEQNPYDIEKRVARTIARATGAVLSTEDAHWEAADREFRNWTPGAYEHAGDAKWEVFAEAWNRKNIDLRRSMTRSGAWIDVLALGLRLINAYAVLVLVTFALSFAIIAIPSAEVPEHTAAQSGSASRDPAHSAVVSNPLVRAGAVLSTKPQPRTLLEGILLMTFVVFSMALGVRYVLQPAWASRYFERRSTAVRRAQLDAFAWEYWHRAGGVKVRVEGPRGTAR